MAYSWILRKANNKTFDKNESAITLVDNTASKHISFELMKRKIKNKESEINKNMEIGALLEDFNSKFDLVAEQTAQIPDIKNKINGLAESMEIVKLDLEFIKNSFNRPCCQL